MFHENTYPELKKRYIDTGKVRFIFREFPLDPLAAGAFDAGALRRQGQILPADRDAVPAADAIGRCEKPIPPLMAIAKQAGFSEQSFNACLSDQKMLDAIEAEQQRATDKFEVNSTPTLFVNGKMHIGAHVDRGPRQGRSIRCSKS